MRHCNRASRFPARIAAPDEVDIYRVAGRRGAIAQITASAESSVGVRLVATAPGRPSIADEGSSGPAVLAFIVPDEGAYEVGVSSGTETPGNYRLDLELLDPLPSPATATGVLDVRNAVDVGVIRSDTGGVLQVQFSPGAYSTIELVSAEGRSLAELSIGEGSEEALEPWPLAPGTPYLVVVRWDGSPGQYLLSYTVDPARPLSGGRGSGEFTRLGELVAFRLEGGPDTVNILASPAPGLDLFASVVQPDGSGLAFADNASAGRDELFSAQLSEPGPHLLVIGSRSSEAPTGHFDVTVNQGAEATPAPAARPLPSSAPRGAPGSRRPR